MNRLYCRLIQNVTLSYRVYSAYLKFHTIGFEHSYFVGPWDQNTQQYRECVD